MDKKTRETWLRIEALIEEVSMEDFNSLSNNTAKKVVKLIEFLKVQCNIVLEKKTIMERMPELSECIAIIQLILSLIAANSK